MSEQFLATAFVAIRPDFKKFPSELKAGLKALSVEAIPVAIAPVFTDFNKALKEQAKTLEPIPVRLTIDSASFKRDLEAVIAEAQSTLKLSVPIQAAAVSTVSASAADISQLQKLTNEKTKAASVSQLLSSSLAKETQASKEFNSFLRGGLSAEQARVVLTSALKNAEAGLKPILLAEANAYQNLTAAELKNLQARAQSVQGTIRDIRTEAEKAGVLKESAVVTRDSAASQAMLAQSDLAAAASNKTLRNAYDELVVTRANVLRSQDESLGATERLTAAEDAQVALEKLRPRILGQIALSSDLAAKAGDKQAAAEAASATALDTQVVALQKNLAEHAASLSVVIEEASAKNALADANAKVAASTEAVAAIQAVDVSAAKDLLSVREQQINVNHAAAIAEDAYAASVKATDAALIETTLAQQAFLQQRKEDLAKQRLTIKGQEEFRKKAGTAGRGGLATLLTGIGARGATLAASSSFLLGAAAATGFLKATQQAKEFQTQLELIAAATGADREEILRVSKAARQLGADLQIPAASAIDAESAISDLVRSGFTLNKALVGARGVLLLAASGEVDIAKATKIATQQLNAFNLEADQSVRVADALTNAALDTSGTMEDVGTALSNVAAPAGQLGLTLEETTAFLIQLAKGGLTVSDSGTVLRTALLRLISPTKKASEALDQLGIRLRDDKGELRADVFVQLSKALADTNTRARQTALGVIFSQRGLRAGLVLTSQGAAGLKEATLQSERAGRAFEEAQRKEHTLSGTAIELKKNLADFGNVVITPVLPALTGLLGAFADAAVGATDLATGIGHAADKLGDFIKKQGKLDEATRGDTFFGRLNQRAKDLDKVILKGLVSPLALIPDAIKKVQGETPELNKAQKQVEGIFEAASKSKGSKNDIEAFAHALGELEAELKTSGPAGEAAAKRIEKFLKTFRDTHRVPPLKVLLSLIFDGSKGKDALRREMNAISEAQAQNNTALGRKDGGFYMEGVASGVQGNSRLVKKAIRDAFITDVSSAGKIGGLQEQADKLTTQGAGPGALLANKQAQLAEVNKRIDQINANPKQLFGAVLKKRRELQSQAAGLATDIAGIISEMGQDAKDQAQKIQDRFDKADQNIINAITRGQQRLQNKLSIAQLTEGVADDIVITKNILAFFRKKLGELKKRLAFLQHAHKSTEAIQNEINDVSQAIFEAGKINLPQLLAQAREEQHQRFLERFDLRIDLANARGNVGAEIRARQAKIKELKRELHKLISDHKGATNEAIKLRIAIAEEQKAIDDLKDQNNERNKAFKALLFTFLQSQQGFAANLFGNLIPTNAASGLVGLPGTNGAQTTADPLRQVGGGFEQPRGASQIASAFKTQAAVSDTSGPTRGGQSRELMLLEQIKNLLSDLKRGSGAPDSKHERLKTGAANDHMGT